MPTVLKDNYEVEGVTLLRQGQRGQPRVEAFVRIAMRQLQALENAIQQLGAPYDLDGASAERLDQVGTMFALSRNGLPDAPYRLLLKGKIAASRSNGLLADVLRAAAAIFQAARVYVYAPTSAGAGPRARGGALGVMVGSPQLPPELYALGRKLLPACLPAGVSLSFLGKFDADKALAFAGTQSWGGTLGSTKDPALGAPLANLRATTPRT